MHVARRLLEDTGVHETSLDGEAVDAGQADGDDTVVDADFEEVDDAAAGDKK